MKLYLFLFFIYFFTEVNSWRIFHNGRMKGGNLGIPKTVKRQEGAKVVKEEWFTQNLDHYNPSDETAWQQRYFVNDEFYDAANGGPVFLMLGGEGEASDKWMTQGSWIDYAKKYGALLFQLEHRYYGQSHPTQDLSTENLKFLSSQQALADAANFITAMNQKYKLGTTVRWVAFGGSYSGSLAAWLRMKYPHLVHGAMSASGPLLAKVDFKEYFKVVTESLASYDTNCVTAIKQGIEQIGILMKENIGQKSLDDIFKLCKPIEDSVLNDFDVGNFYETIADNFAGVVQYNKDNRIGSPKGANITIDVVCDIMAQQTLETPVQRLGKVNDLLLSTYDQRCLDYQYVKMIDSLRNVSWSSEASEGGRQWMYQTCTEFGFYQTSSDDSHIFGDKFPVRFFIEQCFDIFNETIFDVKFLETVVNRTNIFYGGLDIDVDNVVYVHGSIDPWHALGITETKSPGAAAIYIEGTAHCANMYPAADTDLPQLVEARKAVGDLIGLWLSI